MSLKDFPNKQIFRQLASTGTLETIGTVQTNSHVKLKNAVMRIFIHGNYSGNEKFRINFYSANDFLLFSSEWFQLSSANEVLENFYGRIRFDFDGQFLDKNLSYVAKIESENYVSDNSDYVGFALDTPVSQNLSDDQSKKAIYIALFSEVVAK